MTRTDKSGHRFSGNADEQFLKGDALVSLKDRFAAPNLAVAGSNDGRNVLDFVTVCFSLVNRSAKQLERLNEKRGNEMRLQFAGLGPLHVLTNLTDSGYIH